MIVQMAPSLFKRPMLGQFSLKQPQTHTFFFPKPFVLGPFFARTIVPIKSLLKCIQKGCPHEAFCFVIVANKRLIKLPNVPLKKPLGGLFHEAPCPKKAFLETKKKLPHASSPAYGHVCGPMPRANSS